MPLSFPETKKIASKKSTAFATYSHFTSLRCDISQSIDFSLASLFILCVEGKIDTLRYFIIGVHSKTTKKGLKLMQLITNKKDFLNKVGDWNTLLVHVDYQFGANQIKLTYQGETVLYRNNDVKSVAFYALAFHGITHKDYAKFF